jgi:hypothetical protein
MACGMVMRAPGTMVSGQVSEQEGVFGRRKALRGRNGEGRDLFWIRVIAAVLLAIAYLR